MADQAQFKIIGPTGQIEFLDLDLTKGTTTIGQHPDNDIVLVGPGVAPFHARITHHMKPFQIVLLSAEAALILQGESLSPNVITSLENRNAIKIGGYTLVLQESKSVTPEVEPSPEPPPQGPPTPAEEEESVPAVSPEPDRTPIPPPDEHSKPIMVELSAREWTVDVGQLAICQVIITNAGDIVALFHLRVEGVDDSWVTFSSTQVNLNEKAQATVTFSIIPPRLPTTRAGVHHLSVVVTSPNYPGHVSRTAATLNVNPYYTFSLGRLSPRQQTVRWGKRFAEVVLPLANKGNSKTVYRLEGEDDEKACTFAFQVPGAETSPGRQAELSLSPDQVASIPIRITPPRPVFGKAQRYPFQVGVTSRTGQTLQRNGLVIAQPYIPAWVLPVLGVLLAIICAAAGIGYKVRSDRLRAVTTAETATAAAFMTLTATIDSDKDGLSDAQEEQLGTDPTSPDTDGDGLSDKDELDHKTKPLLADTDGDGLSDGEEIAYGANPLAIDSDGDTIPDGKEVHELGTSPINPDTDGDNINDNVDPDPGKLPTLTPTSTPTPTFTPIPPTPTSTPTPTDTPIPPTPTFTSAPTDTPVPPTPTFTPSPTHTPVSPTPGLTLIPVTPKFTLIPVTPKLTLIPIPTLVKIKNLLVNPDAQGGAQWDASGDATIERGICKTPCFVVRNRGSFSQDVSIPEAKGYAVMVGCVSSERINPDGAITGLPYLYGQMIGSGNRTIEYLQGQQMMPSAKRKNEWVLAWGIFKIQSSTKIIRFSLNQAEARGVPQNGSAARFDNLGLHVFDTESEARDLVRNYDKVCSALN